jgi:hypothetical protein
MFGFDPGFSIDSKLLDRFEQGIDVGVRHSTRKIIFGSIALDTAAIKICRELGELPVRCLERKKGVVVPARRFWRIARGSHDHERESAGRIVGHDKSGIRRKTRRGNVLEAPRYDGAQIIELRREHITTIRSRPSGNRCEAPGCLTRTEPSPAANSPAANEATAWRVPREATRAGYGFARRTESGTCAIALERGCCSRS